jgi:hypothetical protein
MNRGRVGEERGGKEMDICPLTISSEACSSKALTPRGLASYPSAYPDIH